jgi:hypothetical protein
MFYSLSWICKPPPMPQIDIPFALRLFGGHETIEKAFRFAYFYGVHEGFAYGVVFTLALVVLADHRKRR